MKNPTFKKIDYYHALSHAGNGHAGNKQYPESVVSDKNFPPSPIHVFSLRAPLSKSTPVVSTKLHLNAQSSVLYASSMLKTIVKPIAS